MALQKPVGDRALTDAIPGGTISPFEANAIAEQLRP
jgi:hypothetical protein